MHALLFRQWKNRTKGRDWFDFEWYIKKRVPLNLAHFNERALQSHSISAPVNKVEFAQLLAERIASTHLNSAKQDVERFIADKSSLDIWSAEYFQTLASRLTFTATN